MFQLSLGDLVIYGEAIIGFLTEIHEEGDMRLFVLESVFNLTENYRMMNEF